MAWKADHIQGVIFPVAGSTQMSALEAWRTVFPDREPDAFQGGDLSPVAAAQASGKVGDLQVLIGSQIGRTDLIITPNVAGHDNNVPPQIQDVIHTLDLLQDICNRLASKCKISRVATVAQLSVHCTDAGEATRIIENSSKVSFPPNSSDNIYQTNVRKAYNTFTQIKMNRVMTWSVGVKQVINATIDFTKIGNNTTTAKAIPVAALKLDFNSASAQDISDYGPGFIREQCEEIKRLIANGMEVIHVA